MDSSIAVVLSAHQGVVAACDLDRLEVDPRRVRRWVEDGELVRVRRGAYVDPAAWRAADPDERYRLTIRAVMRSRPANEVASHDSAVALWGLPLWHVRRDLVILTSDVQETTTRNGLRLTPMRRSVSCTELAGLPVLAVPDALVTTASASYEAGVVAADAALHRGLCTRSELDEAGRRLLSTLRGRRRVREMLESVDPACESVGESRTRLVLRALGLPFESQVDIRDARGVLVGRVDFLVARRLVVEFDGMVKYGGEDGLAALVAEKQREDRIRELGYAVIRLTWDELTEPQLLLERIRAALARPAA
jgi:very-short-patch-repair endonuclease